MKGRRWVVAVLWLAAVLACGVGGLCLEPLDPACEAEAAVVATALAVPGPHVAVEYNY